MQLIQASLYFYLKEFTPAFKSLQMLKKTRHPRWNEEFQFMLEEPPLHEKIDIEVMSKRKTFSFLSKVPFRFSLHDKSSYPLNRLIEKKKLIFDKPSPTMMSIWSIPPNMIKLGFYCWLCTSHLLLVKLVFSILMWYSNSYYILCDVYCRSHWGTWRLTWMM